MNPSIQQSPEPKQNTEQKQLHCFVFGWGRNEDSDLSMGLKKNKVLTPKHPFGINNVAIKQISSGSEHTAIITENGKMLIAGSTLHDKLGIPETQQKHIQKFQEIPELLGINVQQVTCGNYHTMCLLDNGLVYAWGGTLHGKLGGARSTQPAQVQQLDKVKIIQIDCGDYHSVALSESGEVYSWGGGGQHYNKGQLGHGQLKDIEYPKIVKSLQGQNVVYIACGQFHTFAITDDHKIYGWGCSLQGECGFGENTNSLVPRLVNIKFAQSKQFYDENPQCITKISCGNKHSLFLSNLGNVFGCGVNSQGQLGIKSTLNKMEPVQIYGMFGKKVIDIAAGSFHSIIITESLNIYTCGYGAHGQLGIGSEDSKTVFKHVLSLGGYNIRGIFSGGDHSWVVINDGEPYISDYNPPSPLKTPEISQISRVNTQSFLSRKDDSQNDISQQNILDISKTNEQTPIQFERMLEVIYTDVDMCHRFIRFILNSDYKVEDIQQQLDQYIQKIKQQDQGFKFCKFKNDEELVSEQENNPESQFQNLLSGKKSEPKTEKIIQKKPNSYTLMIIINPEVDEQVQQQLQQNILNKQKYQGQYIEKEVNIGDMVLIKESQIQTNNLEKILGDWFLEFSQNFGKFVAIQKYFELRPLKYKYF